MDYYDQSEGATRADIRTIMSGYDGARRGANVLNSPASMRLAFPREKTSSERPKSLLEKFNRV